LPKCRRSKGIGLGSECRRLPKGRRRRSSMLAKWVRRCCCRLWRLLASKRVGTLARSRGLPERAARGRGYCSSASAERCRGRTAKGVCSLRSTALAGQLPLSHEELAKRSALGSLPADVDAVRMPILALYNEQRGLHGVSMGICHLRFGRLVQLLRFVQLTKQKWQVSDSKSAKWGG
jgi:hypothetical protein